MSDRCPVCAELGHGGCVETAVADVLEQDATELNIIITQSERLAAVIALCDERIDLERFPNVGDLLDIRAAATGDSE